MILKSELLKEIVLQQNMAENFISLKVLFQGILFQSMFWHFCAWNYDFCIGNTLNYSKYPILFETMA